MCLQARALVGDSGVVIAKIDVEGAEYPLFRRLVSHFCTDVDYLLMEASRLCCSCVPALALQCGSTRRG